MSKATNKAVQSILEDKQGAIIILDLASLSSTDLDLMLQHDEKRLQVFKDRVSIIKSTIRKRKDVKKSPKTVPLKPKSLAAAKAIGGGKIPKSEDEKESDTEEPASTVASEVSSPKPKQPKPDPAEKLRAAHVSAILGGAISVIREYQGAVGHTMLPVIKSSVQLAKPESQEPKERKNIVSLILKDSTKFPDFTCAQEAWKGRAIADVWQHSIFSVLTTDEEGAEFLLNTVVLITFGDKKTLELPCEPASEEDEAKLRAKFAAAQAAGFAPAKKSGKKPAAADSKKASEDESADVEMTEEKKPRKSGKKATAKRAEEEEMATAQALQSLSANDSVMADDEHDPEQDGETPATQILEQPPAQQDDIAPMNLDD